MWADGEVTAVLLVHRAETDIVRETIGGGLRTYELKNGKTVEIDARADRSCVTIDDVEYKLTGGRLFLVSIMDTKTIVQQLMAEFGDGAPEGIVEGLISQDTRVRAFLNAKSGSKDATQTRVQMPTVDEE
jgi:hypothetical protein